jgi:hypothetical protein
MLFSGPQEAGGGGGMGAQSGTEVNAGTYSQYSKELERFILSFLAFFFLVLFSVFGSCEPCHV